MINKILWLAVVPFLLTVPAAYGSYCKLQITHSRTVTGECIIAEQHFGTPDIKPYLEVTAHGNNGDFSRLYSKVLRISNSGSPNMPPRFVDPDENGQGQVIGKVRVNIRGWNDEYISINASIDGYNYLIWQGRLR